jgi:Mg-chelatase subunit ChlD
VRVWAERLPTATPAPTATPTPEPTPTPLPPPGPVYLPLALRIACTPENRNADVALVVDTSGSMGDPTSPGGPTKLEAARDAARQFIELLAFERDQAALLQFNVEVTVLVPLTADRSALLAGLDNLTQQSGTRIDLALDAGREALLAPAHKPGNTPVLVLLTDGQPSGTSPEEVLAAGDRAREAGILVFTIGLGPDVDQDLLRRVASGEDRYFFAPDTSDLAAIYEQIAFSIPCPRVWP